MILVLGADYVITYHRRQLAAVDQIKDTCVDSFQLAGKTPGFIAFLFLQRCLYDYAHLNLANDNYLDLLEADLAKAAGASLTAWPSPPATSSRSRSWRRASTSC